MKPTFNSSHKYAFLLMALSFFYSLQAFSQDPDKKTIKWTLSERIRTVGFDNAISLGQEGEPWSFARFKTNVGVMYRPAGNLSLNVQLGNEAWIWLSPDEKDNTFGEIYFEQFNIRWKEVFHSALDIKVGRQNIMFDEGFIHMDGQPLIGSRAISFNALKSEYHFSEQSRLSALWSYQPRTDNLLPVFNESNPSQILEEQANTGLGVHFQRHAEKSDGSVYYFRKMTEANKQYPVANTTNAVGARLAYFLSPALRATIEGAKQLGTYGEARQNAFGGYFHVDYKPKWKTYLKCVVWGGFYLSGDKQHTAKAEGWNPMWARWPKWSESYIYTLIKENNGKVAYWSNISSLYTTLKGDLSEKIAYKTSYYRLYANQPTNNLFSSGSGLLRGNLFTMRINYQIDSNWVGHFLYETFSPGNYYGTEAKSYHWLRFELKYTL